MYIAPLRHAVIYLGADGTPFTPDAVATLGSACLARAKGYLARLIADGILLPLDGGRVRPANHFGRWAARRMKTKPGGHRIVPYRAVSGV